MVKFSPSSWFQAARAIFYFSHRLTEESERGRGRGMEYLDTPLRKKWLSQIPSRGIIKRFARGGEIFIFCTFFPKNGEISSGLQGEAGAGPPITPWGQFSPIFSAWREGPHLPLKKSKKLRKEDDFWARTSSERPRDRRLPEREKRRPIFRPNGWKTPPVGRESPRRRGREQAGERIFVLIKMRRGGGKGEENEGGGG